MSATREVDVAAAVDAARLGGFRVRMFLLVAACLALDGFDIQSMAYVAPEVVREWNVASGRMGPVFGAGLLGLFVGSIAFSMVADRIGRRPVLLAATLIFSLFTLATAFATSLPQLYAIRFLAGLGLGAMMPNATALVGEYSPRRHRVATMMIVTNGYLAGAVLGGFLSAWLVPAHGWRSVFWVGGLLPLALLAPMAAWLPESLQLLALRGSDPRRVARWLRRIAPGAPAGPDVRYVAREVGREGIPLLQLFREGRATLTALLWIVCFMNVLDIYFLTSWLPSVVRDAGHAARTAVLAGTAVQVGGLVGTVVLGLVVQRVGFVPVLAASFASAAAGLAVIGRSGLPMPVVFAVAALTGFGLLAGPPVVNALAATCYPTDLRSTGIGSGLGVGRLGAILGPVVAGQLMLAGWSAEALFQGAAIPAVIATAAAVGMRRPLRRGAAAPAAQAPPPRLRARGA